MDEDAAEVRALAAFSSGADFSSQGCASEGSDVEVEIEVAEADSPAAPAPTPTLVGDVPPPEVSSQAKTDSVKTDMDTVCPSLGGVPSAVAATQLVADPLLGAVCVQQEEGNSEDDEDSDDF